MLDKLIVKAIEKEIFFDGFLFLSTEFFSLFTLL